MLTTPAARPLHRRYVLALAGAATLGGLMFGFDIAIIAGAGPFLIERFGLDPLGLGLAFSILLFGCALGALVAGPLSDSTGRRTVMLGVAVVFAITSVACAMAPSFEMLLLARFLGGLGVGAVSVAAPTYVAEVSPPRLRGRMGALYQLSIVTGILASFLINYVLKDTGPDAWRWMFATGTIPSVIFFLVLWISPETPAFLVRKGRDAEARSIVEKIGGEDPELAMARIRASLTGVSAPLRALLEPRLRKPLAFTVALAILVHASGITRS